MTIKDILKNFITSNIEYSDNISYRRTIMINGMMSLATLIFFFFTYINFMIVKDFPVASFDLVAGLVSALNLIYLRKSNNIKVSAFIAVLILIFFMFTFILTNQNSHFGIIWSIFVPFIVIAFNGLKRGLYLSVFFYVVMFYLSYTGIGTWNDGEWNNIDFMRFSISAIVLTTVIYISESAHIAADKELVLVRSQEQQMLAQLQLQAITDGLTGMSNRRHFNQESLKILQSAKENNNSLVLLMIDIDYFKNYNDFYGHQHGDEALIMVAQELIDFVKDKASVFRIGGEEFSILLESQNIDATKEWLNTLNKRIEDLHIRHEESQVSSYLTISCGLAIVKVQQGTNIDIIYKMADNALYKAKDSGRNRLF